MRAWDRHLRTGWGRESRGGVSAFLSGADVVEMNRSGDSVGGVSLHSRHDMGVPVERELGRSVTKSFADHTDRHTRFDRDRGVAVAEIVKSDSGKVGSICDPAERCGQSSRVDPGPIS